MARLLGAIMGVLIGWSLATAACAAPPLPAAPAPTAGQPLTREDLEAWLDGFLPYALRRADIAGAVVVVVKDDAVLLQKGYGFADVAHRRPVDPQRTLFRAGSISKLFTWTAVMQQVEAGKLDLDKDVNAYLDFHIPPYGGAPITLRNLMTHTAGFEEHAKAMSAKTPAALMPFDDFVRTQTPTRIFPPGKVPAYSNYGAALAGYIIERVSGEPFDAYVERHIFAPLGMTHTSFRQPLPAAIAPDMSAGYRLGSAEPKPYELISAAPAGSIAISGADAALFMRAHLADGALGGATILRPQTARAMHAVAFQVAPPLDGMALGFFQEDRNGHRIIGHGGDLNAFHSDMHMLLDDHVGIFISMNSAGQGPANEAIRAHLLRAFMDRYFPAPPMAPEPTWPSAKADGAAIAGFYEISRRSQTNILASQNLLQQAEVRVDGAGLVTVTLLDSILGDPPRKWREVAPFRWREVGGPAQLKAVMAGGKPQMLFTDVIPQFAVLQPAPAWISQAWTGPALVAGLIALVLTAVLWPIAALVRWRTKTPFRLSGQRALFLRLSRLGAVAGIAFLAAWLGLQVAAQLDLVQADASLDPWIRAGQALALLALVGAALAVWNVVVVWTTRGSSWWARIAAPLSAYGCATVAWFILAGHALSLSLNY